MEDQFLTPSSLTGPEPRWYEHALQEISSSEYHIRYQEHVGALQSPNRANDLRITYFPDGFALEPRTHAGAWHAELRVASVGRSATAFTPTPAPAMQVEDARAIVDHGAFAITYRNETRGMRQDFHLYERPVGEGPVRVAMRCDGDLRISLDGKDAAQFSKPDSLGNMVPIVRYQDLLAWDADGDTLPAWMEVDGAMLALVVDDAQARYPLTIDPLSTTAVWMGEGDQTDANYGFSVCTAGDVNGDGRSDIIVGAPFYDGGAMNGGRAFIHHGTATGVNATSATVINSTAPEVALGICVSTAGDVNGDGYSDVLVIRSEYGVNGRMLYIHHGSASGVSSTPSTSIALDAGAGAEAKAATAGDVNGDGYSDVIVGEYYYSSDRGRVYVYHGSASGLSASPSLTLTGTQVDGRLGSSVASAGDVNNDGYSDVIIGQVFWTNGQTDEGRFMVHHGSASGIAATPAFTYESGQANMNLGISVSFAGDVNGDGYGDVIAGASLYFDGTSTVGAAYVFHGSSTGITATGMELIPGAVNASYFGWSVCCAGDVNGDGLADVLVGAPGLFTTQPGSAHVFLGSASGISTTPAWTTDGVQASARFGYDVHTAGDVNGDGFSDVLVGAPWRQNGGLTDEGHARLFLGSADGLQAAGGQLDVAQNAAQFGAALASAGDVNADGYADLLIGAPLYDNGQTDEGRAMLYLGSASGYPTTPSWTGESDQAGARYGTSVGSAGDVNGDGYSDFLIGAPLYDDGETDEGRVYQYSGTATVPSTTAAWLFNGDQAGAECGRVVGPAGDVNGDGYSDALIGVPMWSGTFSNEGRALVFHGSSSGLVLAPAWDITGGAASRQLGTSLSSAGDTNGDGYSDVVVGIPTYSNGQSGEGQLRWYRGGAAGLSATPTWLAESNSVGASLGAAVCAAGDVNGDSFADFIVGAPTYTNGQANEGRIYLFYGASTAPGNSPFMYESDLAGAYLGNVVTMAGDVNGDGYGDIAASHLLSNGSFLCWHGSAAGVVAAPAYSASGTQSNEAHATALANAGDVDGDGFGDLVVGSPLYNAGPFGVYTDAGRVRTHRGGANNTLARAIKQYRSDLTTPVRTSNGTFDNDCEFGISQVARSWLGRRRMKLAWEVAPHGATFQGAPMNGSVAITGQQASWSNSTSLIGTELKQLVAVSGYSFPKWRVRTRHHPSTMIDGQPYGRWHHFGVHDKQDPSVKVDVTACGPLPIQLIAFDATCDGQDVELHWTTASETDNDHFIVQRSSNIQDWDDLISIPGAGYSEHPTNYAHTDREAASGSRYYRLVQVDHDGTEHVQPTISAGGCAIAHGPLRIWPVPATDRTHVSAPWQGSGQLRITDVSGRIVRSTNLPDLLEGTIIDIDLHDLPNGNYHVSITSANNGETHGTLTIIH